LFARHGARSSAGHFHFAGALRVEDEVGELRARSRGKLSAMKTRLRRVVMTTGPSLVEKTCSMDFPSAGAEALAVSSTLRPEYLRPRLSA
jgi:hypothetical protein